MKHDHESTRHERSSHERDVGGTSDEGRGSLPVYYLDTLQS